MSASLKDGEVLLKFPYDERLRGLLRAIPGRRWDPRERAWCVPLDGERAAALTCLFSDLGQAPQSSPELERAISRHLAKRDRREVIVDLARPEESWWLSFATDTDPALVKSLLEHPCAYGLPAIGRALIPVDEQAAELLARLTAQGSCLKLTAQSANAITEFSRQSSAGPRHQELIHEAELRRDRQGQSWVMIAAKHAPLARVLAAREDLRALEGPKDTLGIRAADRDAIAIDELLETLELTSIDPRLRSWLARASHWEGTVEVAGTPRQPTLELLGQTSALPRALRERMSADGVTLPLDIQSARLVTKHLPAQISGAARRCIEALNEGRPIPAAVLELSGTHQTPTFVLAPGHLPSLLDAFQNLSGALPLKAPRETAEEHARLPAISADPFCVPELDDFLSTNEIWIEPAALEMLQQIREQHATAVGTIALSSAHEAELEIPGLGGELKPFQRAGVNYLLRQRRTFLADEQGLGKTIQAIAALEREAAYPAIVVCPASLKLNWRSELTRWVRHREVSVLGARSGTPAAVTIVNYDIVSKRLGELSGLGPKALIIDESHYCKNAAAKRTRAVHSLAQAVGPDGLVLALTGTPVMNHPPDLVSQLRILGRLSDFGSGAAFSRRFRGPDAHLRLHWHLRARCFARRLKSDVLPQLPAKTRAIVPIELDNGPEYRLAEDDVIAWLRTQPLDLGTLQAKVAAALRAERLVRLNALKLLAARGKLHSALAWIHDFLATGEPLVLFARHREIQTAVLERFPGALHILGADSQIERDRTVRAFQDHGKGQLIVCSIEAAAQGLTLTRASNVAFLELDWTPAKHDQAEDRCHRIGQENAVNAYYLLAADTVDETIAMLLERKRAIIAAVTDGLPEDSQPLLEELVSELRAGSYRHLRAVA